MLGSAMATRVAGLGSRRTVDLPTTAFSVRIDVPSPGLMLCACAGGEPSTANQTRANAANLFAQSIVVVDFDFMILQGVHRLTRTPAWCGPCLGAAPRAQ